MNPCPQVWLDEQNGCRIFTGGGGACRMGWQMDMGSQGSPRFLNINHLLDVTSSLRRSKKGGRGASRRGQGKARILFQPHYMWDVCRTSKWRQTSGTHWMLELRGEVWWETRIWQQQAYRWERSLTEMKNGAAFKCSESTGEIEATCKCNNTGQGKGAKHFSEDSRL